MMQSTSTEHFSPLDNHLAIDCALDSMAALMTDYDLLDKLASPIPLLELEKITPVTTTAAVPNTFSTQQPSLSTNLHSESEANVLDTLLANTKCVSEPTNTPVVKTTTPTSKPTATTGNTNAPTVKLPLANIATLAPLAAMYNPFVALQALHQQAPCSLPLPVPVAAVAVPKRMWKPMKVDAKYFPSSLTADTFRISVRECKPKNPAADIYAVPEAMYTSSRYRLVFEVSIPSVTHMETRLEVVNPLTQSIIKKNGVQALLQELPSCIWTTNSDTQSTVFKNTIKFQFTDCSYHQKTDFALRLSFCLEGSDAPILQLITPAIKVFARRPKAEAAASTDRQGSKKRSRGMGSSIYVQDDDDVEEVSRQKKTKTTHTVQQPQLFNPNNAFLMPFGACFPPTVAPQQQKPIAVEQQRPAPTATNNGIATFAEQLSGLMESLQRLPPAEKNAALKLIATSFLNTQS